jgi:hypothetical protein
MIQPGTTARRVGVVATIGRSAPKRLDPARLVVVPGK